MKQLRTYSLSAWILLAFCPLLDAASPDAHSKSPMIHVAEVKSQRVAFHLMIPEDSPNVLKAVLLHAAHFDARDNGRWYRFCAEHGLTHMTLTEFPSGHRRPGRIGNGIPIALKQFADQLDRPELKHIPVLSTGFSAGGMGDPAMRKNLPGRYLGCANSCSWMVKWSELGPESRKIPGLFIIGAIPDNFKMLPVIDNQYRPAIQERLPYTLGLMHGCAHNYGNTATLAVPYLESLLALRLPSEETPPGEPVPLKEVDFASGLRGDYATVQGTYATICAPGDYTGNPEDMVWLPNRATAYTWRAWQTKDSPVDITISANGQLLHKEFNPKKVTNIYLCEGDEVELGLHNRKDGVSPTEIVFWDGDRKLGVAASDNTLSFKPQVGLLQVYAEYKLHGKKAVTNPMLIVVDDPAAAERTAKAEVDKNLASVQRRFDKVQSQIERWNNAIRDLEAKIAVDGVSEEEVKKLRGARTGIERRLEDQLPVLESLQATLEEAQKMRNAVYAAFEAEKTP